MSNTSIHQASSMFLNLPAEVRLRIYGFIFCDRPFVFVRIKQSSLGVLGWRNIYCHLGQNEHGILLTCRKCYIEGRMLWYSSLTWAFDPLTVLPFLREPKNSRLLPFIRRIYLHDIDDLTQLRLNRLPALKTIHIEFRWRRTNSGNASYLTYSDRIDAFAEAKAEIERSTHQTARICDLMCQYDQRRPLAVEFLVKYAAAADNAVSATPYSCFLSIRRADCVLPESKYTIYNADGRFEFDELLVEDREHEWPWSVQRASYHSKCGCPIHPMFFGRYVYCNGLDPHCGH